MTGGPRSGPDGGPAYGASQGQALKFVHVTDPHLVAPGQRLHGLDPMMRFEACIESIVERESDAAMAVITGDLADRGQCEAYVALKRVLARLPMPCHLLLGNHDDRRAFLSIFGDAWSDDNGFVQGTLNTPHGMFLFLDTLDAGRRSGVFCERRCLWLRQRLSECDTDTPVYLFMHHPPFDVHIPFLDKIGLNSSQAFIDAVEGHHNIRHLFFGHVHRPISGSWRGIPFSTLTSTNHQVALNMETIEAINYRDEPPTYSVVIVHDDSVVVHTFPYMNSAALPVRGRQ